MRRTRNPGMILGVLGLVLLTSVPLFASGIGPREKPPKLDLGGSIDPEPARQPGPKQSADFSGINIVYHAFNRPEMKRGYDYCMGTIFEVGGFWNHYGALLETGYISRNGMPRLLKTDADVISSELRMWVIPFSGAFLYSMRNCEASARFHPYIGAGLSFLVGGEKISVSARNLLERWDGYLWAMRLSFAGLALVGTQIRLGEDLVGVVQAEWTQAGKGTPLDLEQEKDKEEADRYIYGQAERPDFDFTGWSIEIGIRYSMKGL